MEIPSVIESEEKKDVDIKNKRPIPVIKKKVPETTIEKPLPAKKEEIGDVKEETQPVRKKEPDYMKRSEIMKKYGIREVDEKEIDKILNSYNGGILSDEDIEKVELTLMKKIKKSVLALSKIKGAEVMVFLDNTHNLQGTIKIITEFRGGGIISRFTGDTKEIDTLKQKIIGIAEIEIKRVFRDYPEILDKFDIEVEFE
jgi:hypothetical protein